MVHADDQAEEFKGPPWLSATLADIDNLDFEQVIAGSTTADVHELAELYRSAAEASGNEPNALAKTRAFNLLCGVAGMYFKPEDTNEPFSPMFVAGDGRRSAAAADFRNHVVVLQSLARTTANAVLRARLSDVVWLLDRKQAGTGLEALKAYVDIVQGIEAGKLQFRHGSDLPFHPETRDYLLRALGLARMLGWSKPEANAAKAQLTAFRKRAVAARDPVPTHWFCELDLQMRVSDPLEIAAEIEEVLANLPASVDHHIAVDLWRLASRAYQAGKSEEDKQRSQIAAAELMVGEAEKVASPILKSHLLADAIAELHGLAGARQRRLDLRNRLVEVQASVGEEMGTFSHKLDLAELIEAITKKFKPLSVYDSLFTFAAMADFPDPQKLRDEAVQTIRKHPLSSLFGAAHLDDEGKVIQRTDGSGLGEIEEPEIVAQVAQADSIKRQIIVSGQIDPARQTIITGHYLSDDVFLPLMSESPFVPHDLARTFSRGFSRFFQGDFVSATYVLTPLLENSLRYVLKLHGVDTTTFSNSNHTQEDRTITSLFDSMRPELDRVFTSAITSEIERVFLQRPGPAVRHGVAHGLMQDGSPYGPDAIYACWIIFRLCLLPLYPHREELGLI